MRLPRFWAWLAPLPTSFRADAEAPGKLLLEGENLLVEYSPAPGLLKVLRHRLEGSAPDAKNGLQLELHLGALVATESTSVTALPVRQLVLER